MDEPKRAPIVQTNRVVLNIPLHPGVEPPEQGVAPLTIDGTPIHGLRTLVLQAGNDQITLLSIVIECEVAGVIRGATVEDFIKENK